MRARTGRNRVDGVGENLLDKGVQLGVKFELRTRYEHQFPLIRPFAHTCCRSSAYFTLRRRTDCQFLLMNTPRKVTATWSKDQEHLLFTFGDGDPETDYFYYVPKKDLLTDNGFAQWIWHLSEKNWFIASLRQDVVSMIEEAKK